MEDEEFQEYEEEEEEGETTSTVSLGSPLLQLCYDILLETPQFASAAYIARHVNAINKDRAEKKEQQDATTKNNININGRSKNKKETDAEAADLAKIVTAADVRVAIVANIRHYAITSPFRQFWNLFCTAAGEREAITHALISAPYRERGLELVLHPLLVWMLPLKCLANFVEIKQSTIPFANLGLFLRRDCPGFPRGGILCEYVGSREFTNVRQMAEGQQWYSVRLKSGALICGADERGRPTCAAAITNDNGIQKQNVVLQEFESSAQSSSSLASDPLRGRVFLVATRDLIPGEELFVCYGAQFWGASKYSKIKVVKVPKDEDDAVDTAGTTTVRRQRVEYSSSEEEEEEESDSDGDDGDDETFVCPVCQATLPSRLEFVHMSMCNEDLLDMRRRRATLKTKLNKQQMRRRDVVSRAACLPVNNLTSMRYNDPALDGLLAEVSKEQRQDWCLQRAVAFAHWNECMSHSTAAGPSSKSTSTTTSEQEVPMEILRASTLPLLRHTEYIGFPKPMVD